MICARRFLVANQQDTLASCVAALVRFENMSFHQPVYVGEVASVSAHIVFTSPHSVLVKVKVTAENLCGGQTRVTNSGELWYVPLVAGEGNDWNNLVVAASPQLPVPIGGQALEEYNRGKESYKERRLGKSLVEECLTTPGCLSMEAFQSTYDNVKEGRTPEETKQELCQVALPGDCNFSGFGYGGWVMKLMDNAAGCSAFRHCRTNVVTVAISSMDFVNWIRLGDVCSIQSRVVFASTKTLEIEVTAYDASVGSAPDTLVAKGMFVFASLDKDGKAIPVPPLKLETEEDFEKAYLGKLRYDAAKRARTARAHITAGTRRFSTLVTTSNNRTFSTISKTRRLESSVDSLSVIPWKQMGAVSQRVACRRLKRRQLLEVARFILKASVRRSW